MSENDENLSWTQRRRFEFLEWKLFWERRLTRSDLEGAFDISTPQASVDLRKYREIAPENLEQTARGYAPTPAFMPRFLTLSADRLLLQLRAWLAEVIQPRDLWFREAPTVDVTPDIVRSVSPDCLQPILQAIREQKAIALRYQSLTSARTREIAPHALAFDGHRWHVRAWCCENEDFRDFVLSRMDQLGDMRAVSFDPAEDIEWTQLVTLRLRPREGLTDQQRSAVEKDYGFANGRLDIEMRAALAFYFIRRMSLDLEPSEQLSPQRLQIELENLQEVSAQIAAAKKQTQALVTARKARNTPS